MKLINSKAELLIQENGLQGIYKMIELAGRTCYKSEDKITEDSSEKFVKRMIENGHTAMLEHGTVYLRYDNISWPQLSFIKYEKNPYSKTTITDSNIYVTTNYRVLVENNWLDDLRFLCKPTKYHEKRVSLRLVTSIGITRELIRHRVFSFANESTRYCNYGRDKFENELTFIIPSWTELPSCTYKRPPLDTGFADEWFCNENELDILKGNNPLIETYVCLLDALWWSEGFYMHLTKGEATKLSAQQAREVLPLCTKSEIVMTGFVSDWKHFFDLRLFGNTGKPHPDMLLLAQKAKKVLEEAGLWEEIFPNNNIK